MVNTIINLSNGVKNLAQAGFLKKDEINIPTTDISDGTKITELLAIVFALLGGIAVIIIMVSGIKFVLSQGDPAATAKARSTIIYAAIGLAVAIAGFSIVSFVVGKL